MTITFVDGAVWDGAGAATIGAIIALLLIRGIVAICADVERCILAVIRHRLD